MGWSDSDDSDIEVDLDHLMKEKEKNLRRAQGEDTDSEPEVVEEKPPVVEPASAQPKPKPKAQQEEKTEVYVPLADKNAEKARQRKLQVESDLRGAEDLFGSDFVKKDDINAKESEAAAAAAAVAAAAAAQKQEVHDLFDDLELSTTNDLIELATTVAKKVTESKVSAAQYRFVIELLKLTDSSISLAEAQALDTKLSKIQKEKNVTKAAADANKRKGNEKLDKNTKFDVHDEMNVMYGSGDWDDGDWEDGDWDDGGWATNDWK